jgi:hypothetical protein
LVALAGATLVALAGVFTVDFFGALATALFEADLLVGATFLVFGSALDATLEEAFFGAAVAFANLTSRLYLDFGNY